MFVIGVVPDVIVGVITNIVFDVCACVLVLGGAIGIVLTLVFSCVFGLLRTLFV